MDQQVEAAVEPFAHLAEEALHLLVRAHVALRDERAIHRVSEFPDSLLQPFTLKGERELGAFLGEPLGDPPGD